MPHPVIPGLQKGWVVREFQQSVNHPRDAVVMCERENTSDHLCNFVSWVANMIEGGCTGGRYYFKYEDALAEHNRRANRLN